MAPPAQADVHFHALPGIDDGPATLEESVALIRAAALDGTTTVVATPHVRTDFVTDVGDLPDRVAQLHAAVAADGVRMTIETGAELGHDMVGRLTQAELQSLAQGPPTDRWLLVETPFEGIDEAFHSATGELRDRGFSIVIAHPERSADAELHGCAGLRRELDSGAVAQVNGQSITGEHGPAARAAAYRLIGEGLVAIVGSDAHGPTRPPLLDQARQELLRSGVSPGTCRVLTIGGPLRLLARGVPARRERGAGVLVA